MTKSTVLVRKRKSLTTKKVSGSDKKNKHNGKSAFIDSEAFNGTTPNITCLESEEDAKIQELDEQCKAEFLYRPFYPLPSLADYIGSYIKVIVEAEYLTNENPTIIKRHIWGNEFYSSDSDIVCILQHAGVLKLQELPPNYAGIAVYFKVSKSRANYASHFKNGIRSRKSQSFEGHSLKFETAQELYDLGNEQALVKLASQMPTRAKEVRRKQKLTRKAREEEQDMSIVFNLSGEPMNKFNLGEFGDKRSINQKVSENIETEVLYLESMTTRYELSYNPETKLYQLKEVLNPLFKDLQFLRSKGVPLSDDVKPIYTDLKWSELLWNDKSLEVRGEFKIPYINGYLYIPIGN